MVIIKFYEIIPQNFFKNKFQITNKLWLMFITKHLKAFNPVYIRVTKYKKRSGVLTILKSAKHHKVARHQFWLKKCVYIINVKFNVSPIHISKIKKYSLMWIKIVSRMSTNTMLPIKVKIILPVSYKIPYLC